MNKCAHTVPITAIIENKGKFLFIKRSRYEKNMAGKWVFPGGKIEKGEDAIQALYRELHEETGLLFSDELAFLSSYCFLRKEDLSSSVGLVFLVRSLNREIKTDKSIEDYRWISPEEITSFVFSYDEITDFEIQNDVTIPGMEVHVRNAIIVMKKKAFLNKNLFSVTEYQNKGCSMSKEYLLALIHSDNVDEYMTNNLFPKQ